MDLHGKTAIVTGGAHRVGRAVTLALAERGCNLVVHYNASVEAAGLTADQIRNLAAKAVLVQADLSQYEGVIKLYQEVDTAGMGVDLLVNSAAIMQAVDLLSATEEDWQRTIDLNLKATFFCLQQAAVRMQTHGGVIVNISDIAGLKPWSRFPIHSISKAGVEMLTRVAALALAPKIRVNAVAPGPVLKPDGMEEDRWQAITQTLPLERGGSAEDVARAVIYLAENSFITGETLVVDGGDHLV